MQDTTLAHNGNADPAYQNHPHAPSDTAALTRYYADCRLAGHPPASALTFTATTIDTVWALAVLDANGSLLVSRHGRPLNILRVPRMGLYFSSGQLPGAEPLPEYFTWNLGRLLTGKAQECSWHCCVDGKRAGLTTVASDQMAKASSARAAGSRCIGSTSTASS
ncbi:MAG: hypothetical protein M3460_24755 [Actinomycetota bacterium]|nr:hypothetical protein [Actinomycetota bacterium]